MLVLLLHYRREGRGLVFLSRTLQRLKAEWAHNSCFFLCLPFLPSLPSHLNFTLLPVVSNHLFEEQLTIPA